ncbi:hypothetical protein [Metabacillus fastidiosus]|uniref:hypothetical protein n=1 Tax=Metabacillus fastidiosus TaxID=1458 RepID=UPI003D26C0EC
MKIIAKQTYVKVERSIHYNEQISKEIEYEIHLAENKILTPLNEFSLKQVLDMSYRSVSNLYGCLYLHTTSGLFAYFVKTDPQQFIDHFKNMKK